MLDVIRARRSVRSYGDQQVSQEMLALLEEAVERAPTSRGLASRRIEWVTDSAQLAALSRAKEHGAAFVARAPLAVVFCGLPGVSDVWVEDCAIAAITLQYAATSLGLVSCWAQIRKRTDAQDRDAEAVVREILGLPADVSVDCIIAVGHPK